MIRKVFKKIMAAKRKRLEEKARKQFFSIKLEKNDIAIDCGANIGKITEHLCKSGADVYCFEPNPYAFKVLQDRFSGMQNVHLFQKGVYDKNSFMKLYLHKKHSDEDEVRRSTASSLLDFKYNINNKKYVEVQIIDLCEFIESLNHRVRILKMDVEGVEFAILKKIIDSDVIGKIDYIFLETHDHKIPELKAEAQAVRKLIKKRKIENINLDWG